MPFLTTVGRNYYVRRLWPFVLVYFVYELLEVGILAWLHRGDIDWGFVAVLRLLGNLAVESSSSLLFLLVPFLLYLLALPRAFHGGKTDRVVTTVLFALFCLVNCCEEVAEVCTEDMFSFYALKFWQSPKEAWPHFGDVFPLWPSALCVVGGVGAALAVFRKRLVCRDGVPHVAVRVVVPLFAAAGAFVLSWMNDDMAGASPDNMELAKDGMFTLFGDVFAVTPLPNLHTIFAFPVMWASGLALLGLGAFVVTRWFGVERGRLACFGRGWCERLKAVLHVRSDFALWLLVVLAGVLLVRVVSMGAYPLMDTTEARYAEMSRKMIESGNWLVPMFDYGVPFWGKPPLSFWASAATMEVAGVTAWGARLAPFLASLAIGALFFAWPFRTDRREKALACFVVLATCGLGFVAAGAVMTDEFLALGTMLAMVAFWKAVSEPVPRPIWGFLMFAGLAVGLLSKGPLCLVLAGLPIFLWTLWFRKWRTVWERVPWVRGTVLMLGLSLPWYLLAERAFPGFLDYFIVGEHFERFVVKGWQGDLYGSGHATPLGMIWVYGVTMFLPWSLVLPFLWFRARGEAARQPGEAEESVFLWLWGLAPLLFFSVAKNILPAYVLPGLPALAKLVVRYAWRADVQYRGARYVLFLPCAVFAVIAFFLFGGGFGHLEYRCQKDVLAAWDGRSPLYYWDGEKVPYSAQFYSGGKAVELKPGVPVPAVREGGRVFLAMKEADYERFREELPGWRRVSEGRRYVLLVSPEGGGMKSVSAGRVGS